MYPQIRKVQNLKDYYLQKIIDKKDNLTLKEFLIKHYKIEKKIICFIKNLYVSKLEEECFKILNEINFNKC